MLSCNVIKTNRIDMKYLLGVLNSEVISFWLNNKGKMQGNNYQIDKEPLMNIPIPQITETNQSIANKIIDFVEQILNTTDEKQKQSLMQQIDQAIYQLYGLTDEEIKIIETAS